MRFLVIVFALYEAIRLCAMRLRACYAKPGTALPMLVVLRQRDSVLCEAHGLCACYAEPGTDTAYAASSGSRSEPAGTGRARQHLSPGAPLELETETHKPHASVHVMAAARPCTCVSIPPCFAPPFFFSGKGVKGAHCCATFKFTLEGRDHATVEGLASR
eukprot:3200806-Rhodomonas_salina.1